MMPDWKSLFGYLIIMFQPTSKGFYRNRSLTKGQGGGEKDLTSKKTIPVQTQPGE